MLYSVAISFLIQGKLRAPKTLNEARKIVQDNKLKAIDKYSYTSGFKYVEAVVITKDDGFYSSVRVVFSAPITANTEAEAIEIFENSEVKKTVEGIAKKGYEIKAEEIGKEVFWNRCLV